MKDPLKNGLNLKSKNEKSFEKCFFSQNEVSFKKWFQVKIVCQKIILVRSSTFIQYIFLNTKLTKTNLLRNN